VIMTLGINKRNGCQPIMKPHYETDLSTRYTHHAVVRMQQRSIPPAVVELLLDFGTATPVGGGACSYRFTKDSWAEAKAALGAAAVAFERYRNAYVVESSDGAVVTVAWLH
jgi:hypothetical protein